MSRIAVISMGQLVSTANDDAAVAAFANASGHGELFLKAVAGYDQHMVSHMPDAISHHLPPMIAGPSVIDGYKTGRISDEKFYAGVRHRLNRTAAELPDAQIKKAWNAMTGIGPERENSVRAIADAVIGNDVHLVIASGTNPLHQEANLEALKRVLGDKYEPFMKKVTFAHSYEAGTLDKSRLAVRGIVEAAAKHRLNLAETEIASFHRDIPAEKIKAHLAYEAPLGEHTARTLNDMLSIVQIPVTDASLAGSLASFSGQAAQRAR